MCPTIPLKWYNIKQIVGQLILPVSEIRCKVLNEPYGTCFSQMVRCRRKG